MLDHLVFDRGFGTLKKKRKKWRVGGGGVSVFEDPEEDVRTDAQMSADAIRFGNRRV